MYFTEKVEKQLISFFQNKKSKITLEERVKNGYVTIGETLCFRIPSPWMLQGICVPHASSSHLALDPAFGLQCTLPWEPHTEPSD